MVNFWDRSFSLSELPHGVEFCWIHSRFLEQFRDLLRSRKQLLKLVRTDVFIITFPSGDLEPIVEVMFSAPTTTCAKTFIAEDLKSIMRSVKSVQMDSLHIRV